MGLADSSWKYIRLSDYNPTAKSVLMLRKKILLKGSENESDNLALIFFNISSAFEVYWDGQLIGMNGKVGESAEMEVPGLVRYFVPLQFSFTSPGEM